MSFDPSTLLYNDAGLIPAIAQDAETGEVLMMAWMNAQAVTQTLETAASPIGRALVRNSGSKEPPAGIRRNSLIFVLIVIVTVFWSRSIRQVPPATPAAAPVFTRRSRAAKRSR